MKFSKIVLIIFTSLVYTQSFASIIFEFTHKLHPSYLRLDFQPYMYIVANKNPGYHTAQTMKLEPGASDNSYTQSVFLLAPDPTGTYDITVDCHRLITTRDYFFIHSIYGTKTISIPKDGSTVQIEAICPVKSNNGHFDITRPEVAIKIDKNYVMGTSESTVPVDSVVDKWSTVPRVVMFM